MSWMLTVGSGHGPVGPVQEAQELKNCVLAALLVAGVGEEDAEWESSQALEVTAEGGTAWVYTLPDGRKIVAWREEEK